MAFTESCATDTEASSPLASELTSPAPVDNATGTSRSRPKRRPPPQKKRKNKFGRTSRGKECKSTGPGDQTHEARTDINSEQTRKQILRRSNDLHTQTIKYQHTISELKSRVGQLQRELYDEKVVSAEMKVNHSSLIDKAVGQLQRELYDEKVVSAEMKINHSSLIDKAAVRLTASFTETQRDLKEQLEGKDTRIKVIIALNKADIVSKEKQLKALALKIKSDKYGSNKVSDV